MRHREMRMVRVLAQLQTKRCPVSAREAVATDFGSTGGQSHRKPRQVSVAVELIDKREGLPQRRESRSTARLEHGANLRAGWPSVFQDLLPASRLAPDQLRLGLFPERDWAERDAARCPEYRVSAPAGAGPARRRPPRPTRPAISCGSWRPS